MKKVTTLSLNNYEFVKKEAKKRGISLSSFINFIIFEFFKNSF